MESYQLCTHVYRWNVRSIVKVCTLEGVHNFPPVIIVTNITPFNKLVAERFI